jgi:TetR/AcrR family transcriptional regulator
MAKRWAGSNLPSRDQQRAAKREALIREAAKAFRSRGFHATSMDQIAASLGVTKGALYRYVSSKQEILFECFMTSFRIGEAGLELARGQGGSGLQQIEAFIRYFVVNYLEQNAAGAAMVDLDALFPEQLREVVAGRDQIDRVLRDILRRGIADGSILEHDVKLTVLTIMGAINWIPTWYSPAGSWSPRDVADAVTDIFVRGLSSAQKTGAGVATPAPVSG